MARPRSFDTDVVLDAAAAVFCRLGFEAASLDDLVAATGLHRGSIYGAFGSKRGLFLSTLRRTTAEPDRLQAGADGHALDLVLVAALELAPRDDEVRSVIAMVCAALDWPPGHGAAAGVLGARLLHRAGLAPHDSPPPTRSGRNP